MIANAAPNIRPGNFTFPARRVYRRSTPQNQRFITERLSYRRAHHHLMTLHAIGEAMNQTLDLDTLLQRILAQVLKVMQLDAGDVRLIQDGQLVLRAAHALSPDFVAAESIVSLGHCQCGRAAQRGTVLVVEDLSCHQNLAHTACACEQFGAVLSVPVQTTERVVGLIHAISRTPRVFDAAERELLSAIGHQVGVAIERAQFHEQLKTLNAALEARVAERTSELIAAQEALAQKADTLRQMRVEERRIEEKTRARIANDLHDGVQQLIIGALFELQAARETIAVQPAISADHLATAQNLLQRIESEMRGAIFSLRPAALDAHGLAPALREVVAEFGRVSQIHCAMHVTGTPRRFDPDAEVVAFRIVQEALNNLGAHSRARQATVAVRFDAQQVAITMSDDGVGFELNGVEQQPRSHLGLIGMRERAESVNGTVEIWSQPGAGTRITLQLPLRQDGRGEAA